MTKQLLSFGLIILIFVLCNQARGQSSIAVNVDQDGLKSESKARSIAMTNTLMPVGSGMLSVALFENNTIQTAGAALTAYGIIMGPSTGNFYAEDYPRGVLGMAARSVGAYLMVDATSEIFGRKFANALHVDDKKVSLTDTKIFIGEVLVLGSLLYNVVSTKASVREYNNRRSKFSLNVTPRIVEDKLAPMLTASINL